MHIIVSDQIHRSNLRLSEERQGEIVDQIVDQLVTERPCKEVRIYFTQAYPMNEDKTLGEPIAMVSIDIVREGEPNESRAYMIK